MLVKYNEHFCSFETFFSFIRFFSSFFCEMPPLRFHWKINLVSFCFSFYLTMGTFTFFWKKFENFVFLFILLIF
ncbi:MAG: hypothetical protein DRP74_09055 [Candidatus Omnitrophota bacterium]|nr:MAG: hypothetical protein DRP74_09055 [Candidatus Omnitrophota bacterium]